MINGVRAVNGQDPLNFEEIDEWSGGEILPDDPTKEFAGPTRKKTLEEASHERVVSFDVQRSLEIYDPTKQF